MKNSKTYGYIRVSTRDQNENRQLFELLATGIRREDIFIDRQSGKDFNRPSYRHLVDQILQEGDLLVVKSIDRLGRNYQEILEEWQLITRRKQVDIKILDMPLLDTGREKDLLGTFISDIVLQLLSFVAENERQAIRQRQAEGIAAAKRCGVQFGRPATAVPKNFPEVFAGWRSKEITITEACALCSLPRHTFYRLAKRYLQP